MQLFAYKKAVLSMWLNWGNCLAIRLMNFLFL